MSAQSGKIREKFTAEDTVNAATLIVHTSKGDPVEAEGFVSVDAAHVVQTGLVRTAAAPWTPIRAWQQTRSCVMGEGCVYVEDVDVTTCIMARPVRPAPHVPTDVMM